MKEEKTIDYREHEDSCLRWSGSSMDCTGLIPALPESEAQLEFYDELYPFLPRASACAGRPDPKPPASKQPDSKNPG